MLTIETQIRAVTHRRTLKHLTHCRTHQVAKVGGCPLADERPRCFGGLLYKRVFCDSEVATGELLSESDELNVTTESNECCVDDFHSALVSEDIFECAARDKT